jgi:hypothetical protein
MLLSETHHHTTTATNLPTEKHQKKKHQKTVLALAELTLVATEAMRVLLTREARKESIMRSSEKPRLCKRDNIKKKKIRIRKPKNQPKKTKRGKKAEEAS